VTRRGARLADLPPEMVRQVRAKYTAARQRAKPLAPKFDWSDHLAEQLRSRGFHVEREYQFHSVRKWRVDLYIPSVWLAVEVEGFGKGGRAGRHQRADGFAEDCEKYAELAIKGIRLIRATTRQVKNGKALAWVLRMYGPQGE